MSKLGIIPAAGRGSRWGGVYKELLPTGPERWLVDAALDHLRAVGVERVCVITSPEKIGVHAQHFGKEKYRDLDVFYVVQRTPRDLWGAVVESLPYANDLNYLIMPDTSFRATLPGDLMRPLGLGLFTTITPERFGVVLDNRISDKDQTLRATRQRAWGALVWMRSVAQWWQQAHPESLPSALSEAMLRLGYTTFDLLDYADMATWEDYAEFIRA